MAVACWTINFPKQDFTWNHGPNLTHWGRVTHICISKLTIIGSDNGLSPGRCQTIIWTNAGVLLIGSLGTNFSEILIEILTFSFKKMHLKISSAKWWPFCLGLNVLKNIYELIIEILQKQVLLWLWAHNWNLAKTSFALIMILLRPSGHKFAHVMALSRQVQNCDLIWTFLFFCLRATCIFASFWIISS